MNTLLSSNFIDTFTSPYAIIVYTSLIITFMVIMVVLLMMQRREMTYTQEKVLEEVQEEETDRFSSLKSIDENKSAYLRETYKGSMGLEEFCNAFRDYAAGELKLYYDIKDIRSFVCGLGITKILILQGMSGTGKTSLAYAFGRFIDNPSTIVPIQPMWKERTDLIGYYNEFTKHFNETVLLKKMYEANYSEDMYVVVLDEMNIARVEYYFAEFLSLLELPNKNERYIEVVAAQLPKDPDNLKDGQMQLPSNMWFIGTANNDDSTFAISDKVYDRAMVINLDKKSEPFEVTSATNVRMSAQNFENLIEKAQKEIEISEEGLAKLNALDEYLMKNFKVAFGNRIMKQIKAYVPVYIAAGGSEMEALDDMVAKKIMRKLEMKNPIHVRNGAAGLVNKINELFGQDNMQQTKQYINNIINVG